MIKGIKFVNIPVVDQARALAFYTEKLGFTVATNQPMAPGGQRWIELKIPGADTRVTLFTPPGHENRVGTFVPLTLWSDAAEEGALGDVRDFQGLRGERSPPRLEVSAAVHGSVGL